MSISVLSSRNKHDVASTIVKARQNVDGEVGGVTGLQLDKKDLKVHPWYQCHMLLVEGNLTP